MEALGTLLAVATVIVVIAYIAQPFLAPRGEETERVTSRSVAALRERAALLAERNRIYRAIRELDFEYQTGKVAEADYADQRFRLVAQGVEVLQQLDRMPPSDDDPIEQAVLAMREGEPLPPAEVAPPPAAQPASQPEQEAEAVRFCAQCGKPARSGDRFCRACGTAL